MRLQVSAATVQVIRGGNGEEGKVNHLEHAIDPSDEAADISLKATGYPTPLELVVFIRDVLAL